MAKNKWMPIALSILVIVPCSLIEAYQPEIERPLIPEEVEIRFAAAIEDPDKRQEALRTAIEEGLLVSGPNTRADVLSYLWKISGWLDFSPYTDILIRFDTLTYQQQGARIADFNRLRRMEREERVAIYREALTMGEAQLSLGSKLACRTAAVSAASEGMHELLPEILNCCGEQGCDSNVWPLCEDLVLMLEFRSGGHESESPTFVAAKRFSEIDHQRFWFLMNDDSSMQRVFLKTASAVCTPNPFTGEVNDGCAFIVEIAAEQLGLFETKLDEAANESVVDKEALEKALRWLARLQRLVGGPDLSSYWIFGLDYWIRDRPG